MERLSRNSVEGVCATRYLAKKAQPYTQGLGFFHGLIHYWQGNSESSLRFLEKAIEQVPERPGISDGAIGLYFGLALCMNGQKAKAIRTLRHLSEACRFTGQTIEIAVLQTQTLEKQGRRAEALDALDETVAIAAPGGWVRPFVEAGELMAGLLDQLAQRDGQTDRLKAILDGVRAMATQPTSTTAPAAPVGESRLRESLTRRELDTLALVAQRLQNKEIAARLFVSVDTVKTHLKNLYSKLEVGNRREAAAKAVEILAESQPRVDAVDLVDNP